MLGKPKVETGNWKMEIGKGKPWRARLASFQFRVSSFHFPISGVSRWLVVTVAAAAGVAWSAAAYAQGCPLCANTVSAAKTSAILALRNGILILIVPPLLICSGIIWQGVKARNRFNEPEAPSESSDREVAQMLAQMAPEEESRELSVVSCQSQRATKD